MAPGQTLLDHQLFGGDAGGCVDYRDVAVRGERADVENGADGDFFRSCRFNIEVRHCCCGLKILILNGSGLQIQTNGTAWNIRRVGFRTRIAQI